jgi:GT2 family glycosyltransferase
MKPISLCVTTFNRQDLLGECLRSAFAGTVKPDSVYIIDNAPQRGQGLPEIFPVLGRQPTVIDLGEKRGCEASAINFYLSHVSEERIIAHDDVVFGPTSIEQFVNTAGDFLIDDQQGVITYRDSCIRAVGYYDTEISPNYFRYVDVDYEDRLALVGIHPVVVSCGVQHMRDGTMRGYADLSEYYYRVNLARQNYEKKWGRAVTHGGHTIGRSQWRRLQVGR